MTIETNHPTPSSGARSLFLLPFGGGDALGRSAEAAGWRVAAEADFVASGAPVALIDARGHAEAALEAIAGLGDAVQANAAALLVLVARDQIGALDAFHAAGATHYLAEPFDDAELALALRFAARHAERAAFGQRPRSGRAHEHEDDDSAERGRRDALTGLRDGGAARRWLDARLVRDEELTLILVSITRFEVVNAAFGAATGDEMLRAAGRRIDRLVREAIGRDAMIARIAGAEFAVGLDDSVSADRARTLAEELARSIARPIVSGEHAVPLDCRIGMTASEPGDDAKALLKRASGALTEAKAGQGGGVRVMSQERAEARALGDRLEVDLRHALDRGEIEVTFQPQVSVTTRAITGVEALARWRHPEFGEIGATTLFAVAERSHYLVPLSAHVQRRALEIAAAWPAPLAALGLSINVTAADIAEPDFAGRFLAMIDRSGFPRGRVTVEITESGLIGDLAHAADLFAALRAGGCRVAIDDFGTGYSSLAYLKALPLDYLKIDKRLADDIEGSRRDRVVVRGVIEMARSLGLGVIAEGVESEAQLALLAAEGCGHYQGFLCSEAVDSAGLVRLVAGSAE